MSFKEKLLYAIKHGMNNEVRWYLRNTVEVRRLTDDSGATLLHYAAEYGNGGVARDLIELGYDVDAQNARGQTPLMLAIREERVTTIRVLLDCRASLHIRDDNFRSALQMVVQGSLISENTIEAFLRILKEETSSDSRLLAQTLSGIGCPLRVALFLNDLEVTRLMLNGANCNVDDPDPEMGDTALHVAVRRESSEHVKLLTEHGANANARNAAGYAPLYNLEFKHADRSLEILKILLDRGAMTFTEIDGETKCQVSGVLEWGCRRAVNLLVEHNVDLREVDANGSTALHYLARNRNAHVFDELIGKKFDVNARNKALYTPLHLVSNNYSSLRFLIENGADVNASRDGVTPFTKWYEANEIPMSTERELQMWHEVELFLRHGADPQSQVSHGMTIIEQAQNCRLHYVARLLLAYLALREDNGTSIVESLRGKFDKDDILRGYYDRYKEKIANWKATVVWESITMFKLLTVSEKQLAMYMRRQREAITMHLKEFNPDVNPYCMPYEYLVNVRVKKAISTAELWMNATSSICDALELPYEKYYDLIESIVIDYLSELDMRNLCSLGEYNSQK